MWFAKLFGGRDEHEGYEEPTAAPTIRAGSQTSTTVTKRPAVTTSPTNAPKRKGFDPYNSGSFERRNAWERIGRR
ncbi:MAG: hypothetical protein ACJ8OJ_11410 [Povalibacter sp.]